MTDAERIVLSNLLRAMERSGWATGRREKHEHRIGHDWKNDAREVDECRCGEPWPCPYLAAWDLLDIAS